MKLTYENALLYLEEIGVGGEVWITSMQRRFMSGYIKTAKMVDLLEEEGFLSELDCESMGRRILKTK